MMSSRATQGALFANLANTCMRLFKPLCWSPPATHHLYTHVYTVPGTGDVVKGSRQDCTQQQACSASGVWWGGGSAHLSVAAGAHGAGMQSKADFLQHVWMGCDPPQPHARQQKLAEAV